MADDLLKDGASGPDLFGNTAPSPNGDEERKTIISDIYWTHGQPAHARYVAAALSNTRHLTIVQLIDAASRVKKYNVTPKNMTNALLKEGFDVKLAKHNELKSENLIEMSMLTISKKRFLNLIVKSLALDRNTHVIPFQKFWEEINRMWEGCLEEGEYNKVMDHGEEWLDLILAVEG